MEPTTGIYLGVKAAFVAGKTFAAADAQVAAAAKEYGISKKGTWAAVRAEARKRNDESLQSLLRGEDVGGSVLDPRDHRGGRAAAKARGAIGARSGLLTLSQGPGNRDALTLGHDFPRWRAI